MQTIDDLRSQVFEIRQKLTLLGDVEKQAQRAFASDLGDPSAAHDLRKIEAQTAELKAELADLEAQARVYSPQAVVADVPALEDAEKVRDDLASPDYS
jgi:hypothetical protein